MRRAAAAGARGSQQATSRHAAIRSYGPLPAAALPPGCPSPTATPPPPSRAPTRQTEAMESTLRAVRAEIEQLRRELQLPPSFAPSPGLSFSSPADIVAAADAADNGAPIPQPHPLRAPLSPSKIPAGSDHVPIPAPRPFEVDMPDFDDDEDGGAMLCRTESGSLIERAQALIAESQQELAGTQWDSLQSQLQHTRAEILALSPRAAEAHARLEEQVGHTHAPPV